MAGYPADCLAAPGNVSQPLVLCSKCHSLQRELTTLTEEREDLKRQLWETQWLHHWKVDDTSAGEEGEALFEDSTFPASNLSLYGEGGPQDMGDNARQAVEGKAREAVRGRGTSSAWERILADKRDKETSSAHADKKETKWASLKKRNGWGTLEQIKRSRIVAWARPRELWSGSLGQLFDVVQPCDIKQGDLGNCWLISAFSVLAARPLALKGIFGPYDLRAGRFLVRVCHTGFWQTVCVDDRVPISVDGKTPLMARNLGQSLWVTILEKAYAKAFGSYVALKAGYAYEALMDLTGAPYDYFELEGHEEDACWRRIAGNHRAGFLQCASCRHEGDATAIGLATGHVYSITRAYCLEGHRVVQLRNPWGKFEWTGDWSRNSGFWTPELREEAGMFTGCSGEDGESEGMFHISFADFMRFFFRVHVCKYREDWRETRDRQAWGPERAQACWELTVPGETQKCVVVHIGIRQPDPRVSGSPRPVPAGIDVIDLASGLLVPRRHLWNNDRTDTTGECTPRRQNQVEVTLRAGSKYLAVAYGLAPWFAREPVERQLTVVVHVGGGEKVVLGVKDYAEATRKIHLDALLASALETPPVMSDGNGVNLHRLARRCHVVYAVANTSAAERSVRVDCSSSKACSFELGAPIHCLQLAAGASQLTQIVSRDQIWGEDACVLSASQGDEQATEKT